MAAEVSAARGSDASNPRAVCTTTTSYASSAKGRGWSDGTITTSPRPPASATAFRTAVDVDSSATTRLACPVMPVLAAIDAAMAGSSTPTCRTRSPGFTPLMVTASGSLPTLDFRRNLRIFPMI